MGKKVQIVYDKQCPACSAYCELFQSYAEQEDVELMDARERSDLMDEITRRGLDIDEGMVVRVVAADQAEEVEQGDDLHYGAQAINTLAMMSNGNGFFDRVNRTLFRRRRMADMLYPLLRAVRNLLLKMLGVGRINNLRIPGRDKF